MRPLVLVVAVLALATGASGLPAERFDRQGLAIHYPSTWHLSTRPLSNGVNPAYRFAVSTSPVRRTSRDDGPCLPGVASQLPAAGAIAYLREALGADRVRSLPRMPARPTRFRLPTPADSSLCGFGRGGRWIPFRENGRAFYLGVYLGPRATLATKRDLARILASLTVASRRYARFGGSGTNTLVVLWYSA